MLLLLLFLLGAQDIPAVESSISGTVTDTMSGARLAKVQVLAEPSDRRLPQASTTTDEKGAFALVRLPPGEYRLMGIRNGYLETYYGARRAGSQGILITLGAGQDQKDLKLKLLPSAVIAGTVRDPEGEPLAEARIALIAVSYRNGIRELRATGQYADTDDLGQYRIPNVRPGNYYVRAGLEPPDHWRLPVDHSPKDRPAPEVLIPAFHPSAPDLAGARKIEVAAGERFTGADVTLVRSRLFRVRMKIKAPEGVEFGVSLWPRPDFKDGLGPHPPSNCKAGVCEFTAVPSGSYTATASSGGSRKMTLDELFSNSTQVSVSVPVDVAGADVDGVFLALSAGAEITGHVAISGEEHPDLSSVQVTFVDAEAADHDARVSDDGSFSARLSPGYYEVQVHTGSDLVPKSIRSEDTDVLQEGFTVSRPGKVPIAAVLSRDGAAVDGIVQDKDDQPVPGATVVLIPDAKLRFRHDLYQQTNTDQSGRYHFQSISPGDYKLFVWDDVEDGIWFDPDFLKSAEALGQAVTIGARSHQAANLRLPPAGK